MIPVITETDMRIGALEAIQAPGFCNSGFHFFILTYGTYSELLKYSNIILEYTKADIASYIKTLCQ